MVGMSKALSSRLFQSTEIAKIYPARIYQIDTMHKVIKSRFFQGGGTSKSYKYLFKQYTHNNQIIDARFNQCLPSHQQFFARFGHTDIILAQKICNMRLFHYTHIQKPYSGRFYHAFPDPPNINLLVRKGDIGLLVRKGDIGLLVTKGNINLLVRS
jgi:hypothetical protein